MLLFCASASPRTDRGNTHEVGHAIKELSWVHLCCPLTNRFIELGNLFFVIVTKTKTLQTAKGLLPEMSYNEGRRALVRTGSRNSRGCWFLQWHALLLWTLRTGLHNKSLICRKWCFSFVLWGVPEYVSDVVFGHLPNWQGNVWDSPPFLEYPLICLMRACRNSPPVQSLPVIL